MALPKLIASDIDGTLLMEGESALPAELFPLIERLWDHGVLFCPASGRQFHSLRLLFAPIAEKLCFLCENGSVVYGPGTEEGASVLSKTVIPREDAMALIREMLALPGCDPLISGQNTTYISAKERLLRHDLEHLLGNHMAFFDAPEEIGEDIVKIAAYCPGALEQTDAALRPHWSGKLNVAVAGEEWLDFTLANKGTGIRGLCDALDIDPRDVLAVGDNWNDVPMLDAVGQPRLMETAAPELRARYSQRCRSVPELLRQMLESGQK